MNTEKSEVQQSKPCTSLNALRSTETGYEIHTDAFKTVMEKVGDRPFVLYSINGTTRTGKSFVLNYLIKYFEARKAVEKSTDAVDWMNFDLQSAFIARGGRERETEGIHFWPEPYFVQTKGGQEVAILVMDTQGLFDDRTTALQNAFIMSVSTLCSSVMIFNVMIALNEEILNQLQFYSNYASTVMNKEEEGFSLVAKTEQRSCQKLLFLMRDFVFPEYEYGLHDNQRMPENSSKNYFEDTFIVEKRDDCPEEVKLNRGSILSNYSQVSIFTLPDPGKAFKRQKGDPDEEFFESLKDLIEFLVSDENLVTKKFGDIEVTGTQFLLYVDQWNEVCKKEAESNFPDVQTIAESTAWTSYSIAYSVALAYYKKRMNELVGPSKQRGVPLEQLEEWQLVATNAALEMFQGQKIIYNVTFQGEFKSKLVKDMTFHFSNLEVLNKKRLAFEADFKTQLKALKQLRFSLEKCVADLKNALTNDIVKECPQVTQHLKDVHEVLNNEKIQNLNFQLEDDVASIVATVKSKIIQNTKIMEPKRGKGKEEQPAASDLQVTNLTSPNLVKNPSGSGGLRNWIASDVIVECPPVGVDQLRSSVATPNSAFVTSYSWGTMTQVIDLQKAGYTYKVMKSLLPFEFTISLMVGVRFDCGGMYEVHAFVKKDLKDGTKLSEAKVLKDTLNEKDGWLPINTTLHVTECHLVLLEHFRYLILEIRGRDNKFWEGHYGIKFTNISVTAPPVASNISVTAPAVASESERCVIS